MRNNQNRKKKEPNPFFDEVDKLKRKRLISIGSMAVFFIVVLIIGGMLIYFVVKSVKGAEIPDLRVPTIIDSANVNPTPAVIVTSGQIVVSEKVLCEQIYLIAESGSLKCLIRDDGIYLSGKMSSFTLPNSSALVNPTVANNNLVFEIKYLKFGEISAPKFARTNLEKTLNEKIAKSIIGEDFLPQSIELSEGLMIISGSVSP